MIKNETDRYPSWQSSFLAFNQHPFIQHMYVLSFALIGVSLLYLVAANWFMLPSFVQLATPQVMLFIAALASLYVQKEYLIQTLHSFCGLMLGLSLAVIGQVYQTGADSYFSQINGDTERATRFNGFGAIHRTLGSRKASDQ